MELTPFWSFRQAFIDGNPGTRGQILRNCILLMPLGVLLAVLVYPRKIRLWQLIICAALLSYTIEVLQLMLRRGTFELVDDPLNNVIGAVAGYLLTRKMIRLAEAKKKKCKDAMKTGSSKSASNVQFQTGWQAGLISVIMGTYNCAETIRDAVGSILNQSISNFELIVCDDASTDETYAILQTMQAENPDRIILLRNEKNSYLAHCLNRCLCIAHGEYIARMDGDDISLPERFEKQLDYLQKHPEIDMVGTGMRMIMDWGGTKDLCCAEFPDRMTMVKRTPFFHATLMARRGVFEILNGYTEGKQTRKSEDIDFYCRFMLADLHGANLTEPLYIKSETNEAMKKRSAKQRIASYRTKLRCFEKLEYPAWCYVQETMRLYKCLVPYPLLRLWRKMKQDNICEDKK